MGRNGLCLDDLRRGRKPKGERSRRSWEVKLGRSRLPPIREKEKEVRPSRAELGEMAKSAL